jgi:hypothetical protein
MHDQHGTSAEAVVPEFQDLANDQATGLRALADLLEANPHLAPSMVYPLRGGLQAPLGHTNDPRATMAAWARAHGKVTKDFTETWAKVLMEFGPAVQLEVYAGRDTVCERVVTGTREVTTTVPDPDALALVPTITTTSVVEDVEWICQPLMAPVSA